jgi:hypothetical protein
MAGGIDAQRLKSNRPPRKIWRSCRGARARAARKCENPNDLPPIDYEALYEVYIRADRVFFGLLYAPWCPDCGCAMMKFYCKNCQRTWNPEECIPNYQPE